MQLIFLNFLSDGIKFIIKRPSETISNGFYSNRIMQIFQTACRFSMPVRMFVLMLMRRTFQAAQQFIAVAVRTAFGLNGDMADLVVLQHMPGLGHDFFGLGHAQAALYHNMAR